MSKNKHNNHNQNNNGGGDNKQQQQPKYESKAAILSKNKIKAKDIKAGTELIMPLKVSVHASEEYGSELPFNANLWYIDADVTMPGTKEIHRVQIICSHQDEYLYVSVPKQPWQKRYPRLAKFIRTITGTWSK